VDRIPDPGSTAAFAISRLESRARRRCALKGRLARVALAAGERRTVSFALAPRQLSVMDDADIRAVEPGTFEVSVGGKQPGFSGVADAPTTSVLTATFAVTGGAPPP
jgi:Fibronectin type III-like domain